MRELGKRTIQISIALGAIVGLIGCGEEASVVETGAHEDGLAGVNGLAGINGLAGVNGLAGINGLAGVNGLAGINGLASANGLAGVNGLASANGLMTTSAGRKTVSYLVRCALAAGDSLVKQDQNGTNYTFAGGIGLCPAWKNGGVSNNGQCMEGISACMMAHVNTSGVHVPLWLDSNDATIGWGIDRVNYPMQEGTFFGDLIDTGNLGNIGKAQISGPVAYYCDGAGFPAGAAGVVAGRLGANQVGAPYSNPFGTGTLCQSPTYAGGPVNTGYFSKGITGSCPAGSSSNPSQGCPDGYQSLQFPYGNSAVPWNHGITVWRNNSYTPVFDTSYQYTLSAAATQSSPMVMDSGTSPIQQWNRSAGLATSVFVMAPNGSSWTISPMSNSSKCLDAGAGTNGTGLVLNSCNGSSSQSWNITAIPLNGSFNVAAASTGRCMNVRGGSTAPGAVMEVDDCSSGSNSQMFNIQATVYAGDMSGATTTTTTTTATTTATATATASGATPCASFCSNPIEMPAQSFANNSLGTGAGCYESMFPIGGIGCGNMTGRTLTVNGTTVNCSSPSIPAKVNGGYCFQASAGGYSYAYLDTW